jgi:hypothetical protein
MNKKNVILVLIVIFANLSVFAKVRDERVVVDKKFEVNKGALLHIEHRYGTVECRNWEENAIAVKVTVRVTASNTTIAEKIFNAVKIEVDGNADEVSVKCSLSEKLLKKNNELTIDVDIMMPESVRLELEHEFGDAYIELVEGASKIKSKYGNLVVEELKNKINNLEIEFGSADIGDIRSGDVEVNYSAVNIQKTEFLKLDCNYSELNIDKADALDVDCEGGKLEVADLGRLKAESKFSDITVGHLQKDLECTTSYGNFTVKKMGPACKTIDLENSFGTVKLYFDPGCVFDIEATMDMCSLQYPDNLADFSKRIVVSAGESYYLGVIGKGTPNGSKVKIRSEYGEVSIFFR